MRLLNDLFNIVGFLYVIILRFILSPYIIGVLVLYLMFKG